MAPKSEHPHMDSRLAERIKRKKAQLDVYRPLPVDTVRRLNEDLRVFLTYHSKLLNDWRMRYIHGLMTANTGNYGPLLNLIGQSVEGGLDLYLEACATVPSYQLLRELVDDSGYPLEYLSWLARQGRIDAVKRGGRWYSTPQAITQYKVEAEQGKKKRGRPPSTKK